MTLAIAFAGLRFAGVITDRRLSSGGTTADDDAGKSGLVEFRDGPLAYGFAGLAAAPEHKFQTRDWLVNALLASGEGGASQEAAIDRLAAYSAQQVHNLVTPPLGLGPRRVRPEDTRTTFLFAGYEVTGEHSATRRIYVLSNFESEHETRAEPWDRFRWTSYGVAPGEVAILAAGSGREHMRREEVEQLTALLKNLAVPAKDFVSYALQVVRQVALRDKRRTVGARCSSVILNYGAPNPLAMSYHADGVATTAYSPDFVSATYGDAGAYALCRGEYSGGYDAPNGWIASASASSKNAPCPCGSGRKYKRCHGGQGTAPGTSQINTSIQFSVRRAPRVDQELGTLVDENGHEWPVLVLRGVEDPDSATAVRCVMLDAAGQVVMETDLPIGASAQG